MIEIGIAKNLFNQISRCLRHSGGFDGGTHLLNKCFVGLMLFEEIGGQTNANCFMAICIPAAIAGIVKPGSYGECGMIFVLELVILRHLLAGQNNRLSMFQVMKPDAFINFICINICNKCLGI